VVVAGPVEPVLTYDCLAIAARRVYPFSNKFTFSNLLRGDGLPLGNDHDLHILCEVDDSLNQLAAGHREPPAAAGSHEKDLRDLVSPCENNEGLSYLLSFQDSSLEVQITCKVQMALNGFPIGRRQPIQVPCWLYRDSETFRVEEVTHSFGAPN